MDDHWKEILRKLQSVKMPDNIECPDCGKGKSAEGPLVHDATCPFSIAVDEVTGSDRQWFLDHPDVEVRYRRITHVEILEHKFAAENENDWIVVPDESWRIKVTKIPGIPGVRMRQAFRIPRLGES